MCDLSDLQSLVDSGHEFGTLLIDPPWDCQARFEGRPLEYETMSIDEIAALPIKQLAAERSHCHLWVVNSTLHDGIHLLEEWGFTYRNCFAWCKPGGGMGSYYMSAKELMLLGVRGNLPTTLKHNTPDWAVYPRGPHSEKPHQIREMIERVSPGPYLEMFARQAAPGWTAWGNQIPREIFRRGPDRPTLQKFNDRRWDQERVFE